MAFATDRMKGSERTNAIKFAVGRSVCVLSIRVGATVSWRALVPTLSWHLRSNDYHAVSIIDRRERIVRLNNLCSFIPDEERAFEFGSTVWQVRVPLVKIFFFSRLLPESILKGEEEYLVIGGEYRVRTVL